jgi:hypothetical protein
MRRLWIPTAALTLLLLIPSTAASQSYTLWVSPKPATPQAASPFLSVRPDDQSQGIRITTSATGDLQWVLLGLTLPSNVTVNSVRVCYSLTDASSYISQVRISEMTTPTAGIALMDDPTDLTSTVPTCYTTPSTTLMPAGVQTLELRLNYASTSHVIRIGAIGINITPSTASAPGPAAPSQIWLRQNYPNPFALSTTIEYEVDHAAPVQARMFDAAGRLVRTLPAAGEVGRHQILWDGKDDQGRGLAAGEYFYEVQIGNRTGMRKMIKIQ